MIARAGKHKWGYDTAQVDAFLARAHELYESDVPKLTQRDIGNVSFDLCKDGYIISQVDAALARLGKAVSDRCVSWQISQYGQRRWLEEATQLQQKLAVHALRAEGERFAPGRDGEPAYDRKQVDRLVDQVVAKTASQLGLESADPEEESKLVDITADRVSNVIFTQRKSKHGYDERQVDYYLVRAVELLQELESYIRLGVGENLAAPKAATAHRPVETEPAADVEAGEETATLFPIEDAGAAETIVGMAPLPQEGPAPADRSARRSGSSEPVGLPVVEGASSEDKDDQFDQLHEAEQAIFEQPDAAGPAVPVPPAPAPVRSAAPVPAPARSEASTAAGQVHRTPASSARPAPAVPGQQPQPAPSNPARPSAQSVPAPQSGVRQRPAAVTVEPAAPPVPAASAASAAPAAQSSSSLAALAKAAPAASASATARPATTPVAPAVSPLPPSRPVSQAAPLEETTSFNPLTDWDDDTDFGQPDSDETSPGPETDAPASAPGPSPAPAPAPKAPKQDRPRTPSPEESLFDVRLPEVDMDIPDISFPSIDGRDQQDDTKR